MYFFGTRLLNLFCAIATLFLPLFAVAAETKSTVSANSAAPTQEAGEEEVSLPSASPSGSSKHDDKNSSIGGNAPASAPMNKGDALTTTADPHSSASPKSSSPEETHLKEQLDDPGSEPLVNSNEHGVSSQGQGNGLWWFLGVSLVLLVLVFLFT